MSERHEQDVDTVQKREHHLQREIRRSAAFPLNFELTVLLLLRIAPRVFPPRNQAIPDPPSTPRRRPTARTRLLDRLLNSLYFAIPTIYNRTQALPSCSLTESPNARSPNARYRSRSITAHVSRIQHSAAGPVGLGASALGLALGKARKKLRAFENGKGLSSILGLPKQGTTIGYKHDGDYFHYINGHTLEVSASKCVYKSLTYVDVIEPQETVWIQDTSVVGITIHNFIDTSERVAPETRAFTDS